MNSILEIKVIYGTIGRSVYQHECFGGKSGGKTEFMDEAEEIDKEVA